MSAPLGRLLSFNDVPGPKLYPIIGNLYQYILGPYSKNKYHDALLSLYREYGPIVRENIGGREIIHIFDPDDIQTVYNHESSRPLVPPLQETTQIYRAQKGMSLGLGNTNGEEWYRLRSNSQRKMLRIKEVQYHLPAVNRIARDFVHRLNQVKYVNHEVNNLRVEVGKWSLENACKLVFDKDLGALRNEPEKEEWARTMVEENAKIFQMSGILKLSMPTYKYVATPMWRKLVEVEDQFYAKAIQLSDESILRFKNELEAGTLRDDQFIFLSYLLSKKELSLKDVLVICLSLFTDGLSTTTPTMLFNLYSLATNQESQEKIVQEIEDVVGDSIDITSEHLNNLNYLKAFVKETFRLWPNGTEVSRYTESDLTLSGYPIPKGTHVDLNPIVHFKNETLFPDPWVHRPERWLRDDTKESKIHPYILTPFGHGTRMCAGRRFAEQDLYVLLATILRHFKLDYALGEKMGQIYNTLLFPDRPVRVKFLPRERKSKKAKKASNNVKSTK